ncbi:conserved hypothetical protein [Candidatus Desulfarcum epimagneticum]|uniref:Zinc/iron-chelating domain-containing protein n=1 Tax=uncultured Desulfobacteraceae bacterium TaxID=218296 RepID=A0A484HH01_9BACT|nr:conserved hypothetical protein [uncultured Desulfobacteraceae bacterium]
MNKKTKSAGPCARCGKCCEKGGPAFHPEDRSLIESGAVRLQDLFCVRKGEPVYDNLKGEFVFTQTDIIKIKGRPRPFSNALFSCLFWDRKRKACEIYENRPLECRAMNCRDTEKIEAAAALPHLSRKDLLGKVRGLWDLIADHQARCAYERLSVFIQVLDEGENPDAMRGILDIIVYDESLRQSVEKKAGPGTVDLFFGKPVPDAMKMMGFHAKKNAGGGWTLSPGKSVMASEKQWCER